MATSVSVALVSHQLASPRPTGVDRYARELAVALADRRDTTVTVCAPNERGVRSDTRPSWAPDPVRVARVRGPRRAVVAGWLTLGRPLVDPSCGPVDLVHLTLPLYPCPTRRPLVATVHDLFPLEHPEWYGRRDRWSFGRTMRSLEQAAAVIAVSEWTARECAALPWIDDARVVVVPEGVHPRFASVPPADEVSAACQALDVEAGAFDLFIGQQSERKELAVVVEALALAEEPRPLVIAGPAGDATAALHEQADRSGVARLLRWPGFVPDEQLHLLLHGARALLHPCASEGFGLTPLEAMAARTPVVVAAAGAVVDTVGDAGLMSAPGQPLEWARAIDRLGDAELRRDLATRGVARASRFAWPEVAAQTRAVYERVLEGRT